MSTTKAGRPSKKVRAEERRRQARRRQMLYRASLVAGAVSIGFVVVVVFGSSEPAVGNTGTDSWNLPSLEGDGRVTIGDFAGKPTVAAFFASWCEICQRELPGFSELSRLVGEEVDFVGINTMNHGSGLLFAHQAGIGHWPLARDIGGLDGRQLATNFGARGSPTTVIYDSNGVVADVTLGAMTAAQLASKLDQLFDVRP